MNSLCQFLNSIFHMNNDIFHVLNKSTFSFTYHDIFLCICHRYYCESIVSSVSESIVSSVSVHLLHILHFSLPLLLPIWHCVVNFLLFPITVITQTQCNHRMCSVARLLIWLL